MGEEEVEEAARHPGLVVAAKAPEVWAFWGAPFEGVCGGLQRLLMVTRDYWRKKLLKKMLALLL